MRIYGLVGFPLEHSFSPRYFAEKFYREGIHDAAYRLFPLEDIAELPALLEREPGLLGLHVTIPHKRTVIPLLDGVDGHARAIGAVNTIVFAGGRRRGSNTDWTGFVESLRPLIDPKRHARALVLGSGGSSRAVRYGLERLGIGVSVVSRRRGAADLVYEDLDAGVMAGHGVVVNTTPLGMHPDVLSRPDIPYEALGPGHLCYDLVYNPEKTVFLIKAEQRGAAIINGLEMLERQAEASWAMWNPS